VAGTTVTLESTQRHPAVGSLQRKNPLCFPVSSVVNFLLNSPGQLPDY
jgi:hypothetical protein